MAKRLVLLRHAKSSWSEPGLADVDRPLNGRGRRAAPVVGRHLRDAGLVPELVLCSSAARARATLDRLGLPGTVDVRIEDDLYGADPDEIVALLRTLPDDVASVLVIAHNPGLEDLTDLLVGDRRTRPDRFPTAAVAELRLPITRWDEVTPHRATLGSFATPRELGAS